VWQAPVKIVAGVFGCWDKYRDGPDDCDELVADGAPWAGRLDRLLAAGQPCADGATATFGANLSALWPALWVFSFPIGRATRLDRFQIGGHRFAEGFLGSSAIAGFEWH
jgi:hypothetical protein